jgi:outer membrane protein OmpA-like peptidoglycan-associated protein
VMFFDVIADNIPKNRQNYTMSHEFNASFVYKNDEDIDTAVFQKAFYRILFDGHKRMVDDSAYSKRFNTSILKKRIIPKDNYSLEASVILTGKILHNNQTNTAVRNQKLHLINSNGKTIKSTFTNRFGTFIFSGVSLSELLKLQLEVNDVAHFNGGVQLTNINKDKTIEGHKVDGMFEWHLTPEIKDRYVSNNFTSNIGGKLVVSSPREKKFLSNKDVYLTNKYNTIVQKTRTNILGSFVFEDVSPDQQYYIGTDLSNLKTGEKLDLLNKEDQYIATLDTIAGERASLKIQSNYNRIFDELTIEDTEIKMDVKATIFGDNVNNPIGKLKIILLNDNYEAIDSCITDNFGAFKFKYLPFLKRFYLSAENTNNVLDVFKNILIYSSDNNLIKVMTHQKGSKFTYNPISAELSRLREIELEDPWLELIDKKKDVDASTKKSLGSASKSINENINFEDNKYALSQQGIEILDKIILVMNTNQNIKIEVAGHTDSRGNAGTNMRLSERRAKTVRDYMVAAGINGSRISSKGFGESKLLNYCADNQTCTEDEHAINRRIEFKILNE